MTMFLVSRTCFEPSSAVTSTLPAAGIEPVPKKASTLFFLSRKATPCTLAPTVSSLCFIMAAKVELRLADDDAERAEAMGDFLEHFRGVQQRLGRDAADVEAGAAMGLALFDDGGLQAELGGADGADIAAGAGADDNEIVGHKFLREKAAMPGGPGMEAGSDQRSRTRRAGSSSASFTRTRKVTASLPSTTR